MSYEINEAMDIEEVPESGEKPALSIELDMTALRKKYNKKSNIEVFEELSNSPDDYLLTRCGDYLLRIIQDNNQSTDVNIQAMIQHYKNADIVEHRIFACGCAYNGRPYADKACGGRSCHCVGKC